MCSERTGKQLLLLGPVRFVNSDCQPNCEYDFSSESGIIQLRVKKKIKPGDELFVKYGRDFFGKNACLCRTCEQENTEALEQSIKFHILLDELCFEILQQVVDESIAQSLETTSSVSGSKKRRIKGRELVEVFNEFLSKILLTLIYRKKTHQLYLKNCSSVVL